MEEKIKTETNQPPQQRKTITKMKRVNDVRERKKENEKQQRS